MGYASPTDHFGLADSVWIVQSASESPKFNVDVAVEDSVGDFACRTKADTETEYSVSYKLIGGGSVSIDSKVKVGQLKESVLVNGISGATNNKEYPVITVKGPGNAAASTAVYSTGISILAKKKAQAPWLTSITGKVNAANFDISANMVAVQNATGVTVVRELDGARVTADATLQACSGACAASAASGYAIETPLSNSEGNTAYGTETISVYKDLVRDT